MEQIEWIQDKTGVFLIIEINNEKKKIILEPKIIGILVSHTPKIFYLNLNINNKNSEFLIDFSTLKPTIKKAKKLKVRVNSHQTENVSIIQPNSNFYKISRGESFMERYLGMNGWQNQEFAFPFVAQEEITNQKEKTKISTKYTEISKPKEIEKNTPKTNIKAEPNSSIKECKKCGYIIADNVDYCPNCFSPLFEAEDGVDFAI